MCQIFNRIQPGGDFFVIDIGRPINVKDWRNFIFGDLIAKVGILKACEILIDGLPVAKANHHIRKNQENGRYWIHSHVEFLQMLENTGFKVVASDKCYRDYSDWAHVKRPPENQRSEQVAP